MTSIARLWLWLCSALLWGLTRSQDAADLQEQHLFQMGLFDFIDVNKDGVWDAENLDEVKHFAAIRTKNINPPDDALPSAREFIQKNGIDGKLERDAFLALMKKMNRIPLPAATFTKTKQALETIMTNYGTVPVAQQATEEPTIEEHSEL
eukprot:TRINITY_DN2871_c0_g1_i1.p1 TRINITY_DN2871_c0_g1~~TRINITY_DN2871_c0_g1_i1.p1  ORF type:complete len:150 (-),score=17.38 TRINITY_DN2871_c0_g1_i1:39-488(-)